MSTARGRARRRARAAPWQHQCFEAVTASHCARQAIAGQPLRITGMSHSREMPELGRKQDSASFSRYLPAKTRNATEPPKWRVL